MTRSARIRELEALVRRLRHLVFNADEPRALKAARVLRSVRARLEHLEAPARAAAEQARQEEAARWRAYQRAVRKTEPHRDERRAHEHFARVAGGPEAAHRLAIMMRSGAPSRAIRRAYVDGYPPEAVRAFFALGSTK